MTWSKSLANVEHAFSGREKQQNKNTRPTRQRGRKRWDVEALEARQLLSGTFFTLGFDAPAEPATLRSAIIAANKPIEVAGGSTLQLDVNILNFGNKNVKVNSFNLDFSATAGLGVNNWTAPTNILFPTVTDGTLDTAGSNTVVASSGGSSTTPQTLGFFDVHVPSTPGNYTLTFNPQTTNLFSTYGLENAAGGFLHFPTLTLTVPAPVVLTDSLIFAPPAGPAVPGDTFPITVNFANPQGSSNKRLPTGNYIGIFSTDNIVGNGDDIIINPGETFKGGPLSNGVSIFKDTLEIPANVPNGTYHYIFMPTITASGVQLATNPLVSTNTITVSNSFGTVPGRTKPVTDLPIVDAQGNKGDIIVPAGVSGTVDTLPNGDKSVTFNVGDGLIAGSFKIKSKDPKKRVNIVNVTGTASGTGKVGAVDMGGANFTGNLAFPNGVGSLTGGDIKDQHLITIGGSATSKPVAITFDHVANTSITSASPIASITATQWIDNDATPDVISAPYITSITTKGKKTGTVGDLSAGDFNASVHTTDATKALTTLSIAGQLSNSIISIAGNIGTVTLGGANHSGIFAGFASASPTLPAITADLTGNTKSIGSVTIKGLPNIAGFINTNIAASSLGAVSLGQIAGGLGTDTKFGLAARKITSVAGTNGTTKLKLTTVQLKTVGDHDPVTTDAFVIRVIA